MMEQMYRRERSRRPIGEAHRSKPGYRKTLLGQSALCLLIFVGCLAVCLSPGEFSQKTKTAIAAILNTQTDFTALPQKVGDFFRSLFTGEEAASPMAVDFTLPVEAPVTSPFGLRTDPQAGEEAFHYGIDLGAPEGEKIKCAAQGETLEVGETAEYGKYVLVSHEGGMKTLYAHCSETLPKAGDKIAAGQVIATVGQTGKATGPHLHFEIQKDDTWLDPAEFLEFPQ